MTLYHIISDQVWQNLLPVLALRPNTVIQLHSLGERWKKAANNIATAAREAGLCDTQFLSQIIPSEFPNLQQIESSLVAAHQSHPAQLINFTGGTKIHAIAIHRFAQRQQIPSFYFDTNQKHKTIISGDTGTLPDFPPPEVLSQTISIPVALAAHGHQPADFQWSTPDSRQIEYAQKTVPLRQENALAVNAWLEDCRRQFHNDKNRFLEGYKLRRAVESPLPAGQTPAAREFIDISVEYGILRASSDGSFQLAVSDRIVTNKQLESEAARLFKLMEGTWWELVVYQEMLKSGQYTDLGKGLQHKSDDSFGETDIVGFDQQQLKLVIVSCKTQEIKNPLDHIQALRRRADQFGGKYAEARLHLFSVKREQQKIALRGFCQQNQVKFYCGHPSTQVI